MLQACWRVALCLVVAWRVWGLAHLHWWHMHRLLPAAGAVAAVECLCQVACLACLVVVCKAMCCWCCQHRVASRQHASCSRTELWLQLLPWGGRPAATGIVGSSLAIYQVAARQAVRDVADAPPAGSGGAASTSRPVFVVTSHCMEDINSSAFCWPSKEWASCARVQPLLRMTCSWQWSCFAQAVDAALTLACHGVKCKAHFSLCLTEVDRLITSSPVRTRQLVHGGDCCRSTQGHHQCTTVQVLAQSVQFR